MMAEWSENRIVNQRERKRKKKGRNTEGDEPGSNIEARHGKEARTSNRKEGTGEEEEEARQRDERGGVV